MKESHLTVQVAVDPGTRIEDAFSEAVSLASKLDLCVTFNFNDVTCTAFPAGSPSEGVKEYSKSVGKDSRYKFAFAR
jgi:hypothetical protein